MSRQRNFNYIEAIDHLGNNVVVAVDHIISIYYDSVGDMTVVYTVDSGLSQKGRQLYDNLRKILLLAGDIINMEEVAQHADGLTKIVNAMEEVVGATHPVMVSLKNPDKIIDQLTGTAKAIRELEDSIKQGPIQGQLFDPSKLN